MKMIPLKKYSLVSCVVLLAAQLTLISAYSADTTNNRGEFSASDYKFAKAAACGGMLEVNLGNMAQANSHNPDVQQFGQRMVADHGKAGQDLTQLASRKGATLPAELSGKHQKEVDRLAKLSGPDFDRAYIALMVKCHKNDEKEFKHASVSVQDPDLKAFATTTLAVVQEHLKMVEDMNETMKHQASNK